MVHIDKHQPVFEAIKLFKNRCLLTNMSMIWPEQSIWTLENLHRWKTQVSDKPNIEGSLSFREKLDLQLVGAPPVLWGLAADMHYVFYLPSSNVKMQTRLNQIEAFAQKSGFSPISEGDPIWVAHGKGFVTAGIKYLMRFPQILLLSEFAMKVKEQDNIESTLNNPKQVQYILDEILESIPSKSDRAYDFRQALLYMLFPDYYEPIISMGDKAKIISHYAEFVSEPTNDQDAQLFQIRKALIKTRPTLSPTFSFHADLIDEWKPARDIPILEPTHPDSQTGSIYTGSPKINNALRLLTRFKNLILFGPPGTGKTYWAQKISEQIVASQLQHAQSRAAFLLTIIEDLSFYEILALGMYQVGHDHKFSVQELEEMEVTQARFRQNPVKHPKNQIWGYLQAHTHPESQTVKLGLRADPFLFDKTSSNSLWFLTPMGKEYVQNTLGDRLNQIRQGPPITNQPGDFIQWITFHQSYAYEDFVEGLRPRTEQTDAASLSFEMRPGIFRNLCARAQDDPDHQYVLIIDEINRGNVAKIFGELLSLIEADKRGSLYVDLPYSKEKFGVPPNLYIIATMNTADRSIALLDVALRRRFAFFELMPEPELLDSATLTVAEEDPLNLGDCLRRINQQIAKYRGADYQIGHSYFLPLLNLTDEADKLECLDDIWNYQVMPLLGEYFYGQMDILRQVLPSFFNNDSESSDTEITRPISLHAEELVAALNKL